VALRRADALTIFRQREPTFVVVGHEIAQFVYAQVVPGTLHTTQQITNQYPTARIHF
jgi:hypothetical protein